MKIAFWKMIQRAKYDWFIIFSLPSWNPPSSILQTRKSKVFFCQLSKIFFNKENIGEKRSYQIKSSGFLKLWFFCETDVNIIWFSNITQKCFSLWVVEEIFCDIWEAKKLTTTQIWKLVEHINVVIFSLCW